MTVKELIEELNKLPQDIRVVLKGYERGYEDVSGFSDKFLKLNVNDEWYYGAHESVLENESECKAILIY